MDTDPSRDGFASWLSGMKAAVGDIVLEAVVGAMAGELEGDQGKLRWSPNLPAWKGLAIRRQMAEAFGCPVYIMNDVVLCGIGEANDGAGIKRGVMAYFTVSTGVNAVRLVDGAVDPTMGEFELGSQLVAESDSAVGMVTLESLIGGASTQQRLGKHPRDIHDPKLWDRYSATLARAVYNTVLYWSPDVIVFGGSMMRDIKVEAVAKYYHRLPQILPDRPKLAAASLGDLAGLHGALHWWRGHKK